ncbi:TonB-dependent receptor [Alteromonas sediminis]|uniref:TonB-dependent receptor n=1 Tax=Alteromonas sediminis TaxID=2259342 RepID=A0A3N5Y1M1_9ALTE|nr:TonB-dependent receptor [Alteromonas sediminis]RPJ66436.1 TonB-dependent receptor [Alteromonas sediminis]
MISKTLIAKAVQSALLLSAFSISSSLSAQEENTNEVEKEEEVVEKVVVTGSRVAKAEFSSASPVQVIDGEFARDLGLVDAADLLAQTTVVQGQQFTTGLSTSAGLLSDSGPGSATASLRGLDPGRTLVMVNGRRLAPAGVRGAPSAPDLNLVPGSLIQRVDVLLDGASSVYGSDAVAGVVNYVLRTDFDGLQLDFFTTSPQTVNGGGRDVFSATWGMNTDRGFMGFALEHSRRGGFTERDFADFYSPYAGNCRSAVTQGASGTLYESCTGSFGAGAVSGAPQGFLGFEPGRVEEGLPPGFFRIPVTADLLLPDSANGAALLLFPEELNAQMFPDFERTTFYSYGEYSPEGWYGDATTYFEASWGIRDTYTNTSGQGNVRISGDYALGNFGQQATLYFNNRFENRTEVAQTRLTAGVKGDLPFLEGLGSLSLWTYDAYASYSRSSGQDKVKGIPFFPRLQQTLENTRIDANGNAVCDPRTVPGVGQTVNCRPLNFFDPTFILTGRFPDQADNDYLFPNRMTNTIVEQSLFNAFVAGEIFELPSGSPASLVLGVEYRKDEIRTDTDAGASAGDFQGFFGDPGSNGDRTLKEAFVELDLPILGDMDFISDLSFNLAARYTEEENFGEETTYRIQGQYAPVEYFRIRSSIGTSFRAPNLGEQFGGQVTGFEDPSDPCRVPGIAVPFVDHDNDPNTPEIRLYNPDLDPREQVVLDNCRNGGGPYGLAATDPEALGTRGLGTQNPIFFGAPTQVASGSNPDLQAETSESKTFGIVFEQPWLESIDFNFSTTYFEIEIENEVDQLGADTIVGRCYNSVGLSDEVCQYIVRDPRIAGDATSGEISFVEALQLNLGKQIVEGIDFNIDFSTEFNAFDLEDSVEYGLIVRATKMLTDEEEEIRIAETFIDNDMMEFGNPEWRVSLTNIFSLGDFNFVWQSRYISRMIEDNDDPEDAQTSFFNPCRQANDFTDEVACLSYDNLDPYWVHDASLTWSRDEMTVRVGINNVFDEAPPYTNNNALSSIGGIGYDLGGRTVFGNITVGF